LQHNALLVALRFDSDPAVCHTGQIEGRLTRARSLLFAPASDGRKLAKALASEADAVVADLEDAVLPAEKAAARDTLARIYAGTDGAPLRLVRVNGAETAFFPDDLALVRSLQLDAIVLPKASPSAVEEASRAGHPVLALVETATGVLRAEEIASAPDVVALLLGGVDLSLQLGLEQRPDGLELLHARSSVVVASAAAGIRPPFDVVHMSVGDDEGLEQEALLARSLGFGGKACIHPRQLPAVHRVFSRSADSVAWARRVVETAEQAAAEGRGAALLDGSLVDAPVVERARRILAESGD
jgi:citrate lyase beta subunit